MHHCRLGKDLLNSATETLVLLGVIILQANLQFYALPEAALLSLGALQDCIHTFIECVTCHLAVEIEMMNNLQIPNKVLKSKQVPRFHAIINSKLITIYIFKTLYMGLGT